MTEDYYFLANRIRNLERHVEILIDWFEQVSPSLREMSQNIQ